MKKANSLNIVLVIITMLFFLIPMLGADGIVYASTEYGRLVDHNDLEEGIIGAWIWDRDSEDGEHCRPPIIYCFKEDGTYEYLWWPSDGEYDEDFDDSKSVVVKSNDMLWESDQHGVYMMDYYDDEMGMAFGFDFNDSYDINGHTVVNTYGQAGNPCVLIAISDLAYEEFKEYIASDWEFFDYDTLKSQKDNLDDIIDVALESPSYEYNPKLAYELIKVANKAYGVNDGADEGKVIKEYLESVGIGNVEKYNYYKDKYDSRYKRDSVAYSIGYSNTYYGRVVMIVIRGSFGSIYEMTPDWKSNLHLNEKLLGVQGWHHGFEIASEEVYNKLKERGLLQTNGTKYIITGHSRGGGVGNLLAVRLSDAGVAKENVYDYNFACPDTNRGWPTDWNWNGVHDNIFNIGYCGDPVTMLPGLAGDANFGTLLGITWGKYGKSVWYADDWKNFETADWSFAAHDGTNYIRFLSNKPSYNYFRSWDQMNISQVTNRIRGVLSVFSCPVDVYAKNGKGEVLASVINDEINYSNLNDGSVCVVTYGDKKCFFVMDGTNVNYELIGTDSGTMKEQVFFINKLSGEEKELKAYTDIKLAKGKRFVSKSTVDSQSIVTIDENGAVEKIVNEDGAESHVDLSGAEVVFNDCVYNGKKQKPKALISIAGAPLNPAYYSVSYSNNKNVGKATATLIGKDSYSGKKTVHFWIIPKSTTLKKPKAARKAITVQWKKQTAKMGKKRITGYTIQYSTDKSFEIGAKVKTIKGYKKTSLKLKKLKARKKYYIRIRTYMKVGEKIYYSAWSKAKSVRTK